MKRFNILNHPNYFVTNPKILYIDRYGNIFPDCKTYKTQAICHITDKDAISKINSTVFGCKTGGIFNMITVELSSVCQAECIYCFQRNEYRNKKYQYFDELLDVLQQLETYWLFFSGGEILVQPEAMSFIENYKKDFPDTWLHLKTNGCVDENLISFVDKNCDSIMVSFNGFSQSTYETIMNVNIEKTKAFCKSVKEKCETNLGLKLLNSPITIAETPDFLEWAIALSPQCIAIQSAYNYSIDDYGKCTRLECTLPEKYSSLFWTDAYTRIAKRMEVILKNHLNEINKEKNYLTADRELIDRIPLDPEFKKLFRTDGVYIIE